MIVLWGLPDDPPTAHIAGALTRMDVPILMLDQRRVLQTEVDLSIDGSLHATLRMGGAVVDLDTVTGAYVRPHDVRRVESVEEAGPGSTVWQHAVEFDDAVATWAEITEAFVVSRPSAMASNGSKPYQSQFIRRAGFEVPSTLLTTDPEAAYRFWENHREVIYKSISGVRSIVSRLRRKEVDRLDDVVWCPTQFQEYVPGVDHRAHVVGTEVFACQILSAADDYRYAARSGEEVYIRACELPTDVADGCVRLAADLDLPVAGVDLRLGSNGVWFCFEVNPSPGFTYYQLETGQRIGDAVARLLATGGG